MSGGKFDYKHTQVELLAEEMQSFVDKQWQFKREDSVPDEQRGERNHKLSCKTLNQIEHASNVLCKAAKMAYLADLLLSSDISEESFNLMWEEQKLND
jgi:hypothetical protein